MKKQVQIMLFIALCAFGLTGCGKSSETREQQMMLRSQGMEQALAGEYDAAISSYDEALSLAGMTVDALELDIAAYKASALYHNGQLEDAIELYGAILDLKKTAEIYLARGLLYRETGNMESANADFSAAMELTSSKDQVMLGRLSYYMEEYSKAKEYLEAATAAGDPEGVYWQAELYWEMGNEDYAVTMYQNYLAGDEIGHPSAYLKVASWQYEQEEYSEALSTLESGIARGDADSLKGLLACQIAVYEQLGDFETAKIKMESYLESYPDDEEAQREYEFLRSR